MIIDTVEARFVDEGDFLIIDSQECTVVTVTDEIEHILITYLDEFDEKVTEEFPIDWVFEIWGN